MDIFLSEKSRSVAFLLSFFLGAFGAHRFYVGKGGSGVTMLLLTITILLSPISAIWALVDCIVILTGSFRDADGKKISKW